MIKNLSLAIIMITIGLGFSGCGTNTGPKVTKVYETSYPEGISVFVNNAKVRQNIKITDARISYGKNKRQVQCILNNNSSDIYNLVLDSEWTDDRGVNISSYPRPNKVSIAPGNAEMIILNAPNYKAKDVLIKVKCGTNCIVKPK